MRRQWTVSSFVQMMICLQAITSTNQDLNIDKTQTNFTEISKSKYNYSPPKYM